MQDVTTSPQSTLADLRYYFVWATRRRRPFLDGAILDRTVELFVEAADALGAHVARVSSGGDYVIVTVEASPELSPALLVGRLKRHSASRLRREFPELRTLPSIWTRQFLATTRDDFPSERIAQFVEEQPRNERRRYPQPGSLQLQARERNRELSVEIQRLPPLTQVPSAGDASEISGTEVA